MYHVQMYLILLNKLIDKNDIDKISLPPPRHILPTKKLELKLTTYKSVYNN